MLFFCILLISLKMHFIIQYWLIEADNDEIELQNIVMTSFQWRHHHYVRSVPKITSQIFFQFGPLSIKISGYVSGLGLIIWWSLKKAVLVLKKWSWSWKFTNFLTLTTVDFCDYYYIKLLCIMCFDAMQD